MDYNTWSSSLLEISLAVSGESDLETLIDKALKMISRKLSCSFVCLYALDPPHSLGQAFAFPKRRALDKEIFEIACNMLKSHGELREGVAKHTSLNIHFTSFMLEDYGILLLATNEALEDELLRELLPIMNSFALNILGCKALSELKIVEGELRRDKTFLRSLIDTIPELIFFKDSKGKYLLVNEAGSKIMNISTADFVGLTDFDIHDEEEANSYKVRDLEIMSKREGLSYETFYKENNNYVPYEVSLSPFVNSSGEVEGIIGIARNITYRKIAEETLNQRMEFQRVLTSLANKFINVSPDEKDEAINYALKYSGEYLSVDRAYVFMYDFQKGIMNNTHEWCEEGIEPSIELL